MMLYGKLFKVYTDWKMNEEITWSRITVAFKVEKHISMFFFPVSFQEILSVAKKSKGENQVRWHILLQFKSTKPKGREGFLYFVVYF